MKKLLVSSALLLLAACSGAPEGPSEAPPKYTGMKIGKPYSVAGKWYKPEEDPSYDKVGMASWYGPGFNGKSTANGEVFNQYDMTAAHPTLPMPSFVRVTNLENNRQAVVRVNDRGPFHSNRIIDLSKAAAEKLDIKGISKVRVQFLPEETSVFTASNGTIWPHDLQPKNQVASNVMSRETLSLTPSQDAGFYQVDDRALNKMADSHDFTPAPQEIANNNASVVASVPVISVGSVDTMPRLIKSAVAEEKPYPSALTQQPEVVEEEIDAYSRDVRGEYNLSHRERSESAQAISGEGVLADIQPSPDSQARRPLPVGEVKSAWSVQIASFSERINAEKLTQKLMKIGQPELQPVLIDGKEWYRVYLHPANNRISKEQLLAELQKMGLRDARIVN